MNIDAKTEEFLKNSDYQKQNEWIETFWYWKSRHQEEDSSIPTDETAVSEQVMRVKNPFRSGNITEQMKLYKTDKQLYKKMRAEAFEELEKKNPQEAMNFCLNHGEIV